MSELCLALATYLFGTPTLGIPYFLMTHKIDQRLKYIGTDQFMTRFYLLAWVRTSNQCKMRPIANASITNFTSIPINPQSLTGLIRLTIMVKIIITVIVQKPKSLNESILIKVNIPKKAAITGMPITNTKSIVDNRFLPPIVLSIPPLNIAFVCIPLCRNLAKCVPITRIR